MDLNATAFLRAILPDQGWYAAWTRIDEKRRYNRFFATIEELAAHIAAEDAKGRAVYHACATFLTKTKRTQVNAWGARSLWLDVDAGKNDSAYATAMGAAEAVLRLAESAQLPRPIFCGSGYGVHAYWPLLQNLCASDWLELARGLRACVDAFGLHADQVRTCDLASVLRTPGTHNRKLGAVRLVECGPLEGPYDVALFEHLLDFAGADVRSSVAPLSGARDQGSPSTEALIVRPDYAPIYADAVADHCAQLAWMRSAAGCTPEPHWYACLGVLSRCVDGEDKAHEWSSGHPQYSESETQAKLERTLALTGATTCAKFESVDRRGCEQCPHRGKISSPVSLGHISRDAVLPRQQTAPMDGGVGASVRAEAGLDTTLPVLYAPYAWSERSQLVFRSEDPKGKNHEVLISQYPIYLAGVGVGEVRGDHFGFHFKQWLPHRGFFDIHIEAGKLVGPAGLSTLAERGATIHDFKLFLSYVRSAVDAYHATDELKMHFDQCGWKDDATQFLIGNALYDASGVTEGVTCAPELAVRAQWLGPQVGTLNAWSDAANSLFVQGCEAQSFALACSFAAPLMRWQASDEGGAVVNLMSRGSGSGKTTALAAVYSAWGKEQGLSLTNSDTRVAKSITLGVLSNLPVIYDELGNRDPQVIRDFILMFTNGRDKMRGAQDGTINHTKAGWQTLLVSSSNLSIYDLLANTGGTDAPAFRVLEFPCKLPEHVRPAAGDKLRKQLVANAGWAGDAYVDYLVQPGVMPWVRQALEQWTAEYWAKCGNRPEYRFWMRTIGAVAVASTIVNKLEILSFQPSRIVEWAMNQIVGMRREPILTGTSEHHTRSSIGVLGDFLNENLDAMLVVQRAFRTGVNTKIPALSRPLRHIYMRFEIEGQRLLIAEKPFREWLMKREIGSSEVIGDLERVGLITNKRRYMTLTAGTELVGAQIACIELDGKHPSLSDTLQVVVPQPVPEQATA